MSLPRGVPCYVHTCTATHCNILQRADLQHSATEQRPDFSEVLPHGVPLYVHTYTARHCSTLQHTATHHNTLQLSSKLSFDKVSHVVSLYIFTHTLQRIATRCITLQLSSELSFAKFHQSQGSIHSRHTPMKNSQKPFYYQIY